MKFPLAIPAFSDNYIWLVAGDAMQASADDAAGTAVIIIDPGAADPVVEALAHYRLQPCAILITHHHYDHIDGIPSLLRHYPSLPVYGPANSSIRGIDHPLDDNDEITLDNGMRFQVLACPGHTLDHISYYHPGMLFCGDTLFAAGCGRLFEGSAEQMYHSLSRLAALPDDTAVFCTHEYTLTNLEFAHDIEPDNEHVLARLLEVRRRRGEGRITLPSTLAEERRSNPYLRCGEASLMAAASRFAKRPVRDAVDTFRVIRFWKDGWTRPG